MVKCSLKERSVETELGLLMTFLFLFTFKVLLSFITNVKMFILQKYIEHKEKTSNIRLPKDYFINANVFLLACFLWIYISSDVFIININILWYFYLTL